MTARAARTVGLRRWAVAVVAGLLALTAGCGDDGDADDGSSLDAAEDEFDDDEFADEDEGFADDGFEDDDFADDDEFDDDEFDDDEFADDGVEDDGAGESADGAEVAGEPCTPEELGADELTEFTTAHRVVDGSLGPVCLGSGDDVLLRAWEALATISPPGQLSDLGVFSGFESGEDGDEVTLAFVSALDDEASQFQMAVNLAEYTADQDQALLTMAHEFSHVFNGVSTQVDRSAESQDDCATYDNGEGCYYDDALMWGWIEEFWLDDGMIDEVDPYAEATGADGEDRCARDAGFFGSYAASTPEEDFAEAFSAFVFEVEAATPEQQERLDWLAAQPGLAEFRDRAAAAGLTPIENLFEVCG